MDLKVYPGARLILIGDSGSGKSVLSYSIAGLIPTMSSLVQSGEIYFTGNGTRQNLLTLSSKQLTAYFRKQVSVVFQDAQSALDDNVRIDSFFNDVLSIHNKWRITDVQSLLKTLHFSNPDEILKKYPFQLSGGQKQRLVIAAALLSHPRLIILDEATASLDTKTKQVVLDTIYRWCEQEQIASIHISHDLASLSHLPVQQYYKIHQGQLTVIDALPDQKEFFRNKQYGHSDQEILRLEQVSLSYIKKQGFIKTTRHTVIDNFSMQVKQAEILGIFGPSGGGKSTLGKALAGLHPLDAGQIIFQDEIQKNINPYAPHPLREKVLYLPQDAYGSFHPIKKLGSYFTHRDLDRLDIKAFMDRVGIKKSWFDRFPDQLSGGQRQRLLFLRAVLKNPKVIICDELFSGLDHGVRNQLLQIILDLRETQKTFIIISHDMHVLRHVCDRIVEIPLRTS